MAVHDSAASSARPLSPRQPPAEPFAPGTPATAAMVLAPMAKVRKVALVEREIRERLGDAAIDVLLGGAQVLAEGQRGAGPGGDGVYLGTVMLTIELARVRAALRGVEDAVAAARRVADLMARDLRVDRRIRKLALAAAERKAGARLREPTLELRVRAQSGRICVDVDVEGALAGSLAGRHP